MAPLAETLCRCRRHGHESLPWPWNITTSWVGVEVEGRAYRPDASPSALVKAMPSLVIDVSVHVTSATAAVRGTRAAHTAITGTRQTSTLLRMGDHSPAAGAIPPLSLVCDV